MQAVGVVPAQRELRLLAHPEPALTAPHELKIRTVEVGICGTDREICTFAYGQGPAGSDYLILGHECLGEVTEVGAAVQKPKPWPCEREYLETWLCANLTQMPACRAQFLIQAQPSPP